MPINSNIALGVQQQQPVNMLGQLGQIMAIKAAQQEMEGSEGVRSAFAQGAPDDPTKLLQYGKQGRATYESLLKGRKEQLEAASKSNDILGGIFGGVLQDPSTGPQAVARLKDMGLMTEAQAQKVIAEAGSNPDAWRKLAKPYYEGAISAAQRLTAETSRYATNVAAGTAANRLKFDVENRDFDRANPALERVEGDNGIYLYNKRDPNSAVPLGMRPSAPLPAASPAASAAPANGLLMTTQPTATNLNAFTGGSPNQAGPTIANAIAQTAAAAAQPTIIKPKQTIRQPVAVIKDGVVTLVPPEQAVGMTPATPGAEKALEKTVIAKEGKESVNRVLGTLHSEYSNLVKSGGITDTRRSTEENIAARTGASGVGQLTGSFTGSEAQSFRDTIEQTRPLLLTAIMKATGLSATQLNSNVELQTYLKTATDPKVSIQSNVKALNNISQMFGIGEKFEVPEIKTSKSANPADAPPAGLSPEIAKLWQYMPAEDRKLWLK